MRPGRPGSSTRIPKAEHRIAGAQLYGLAFTIKIIKMGGHRIKGHFDSVVQPVDMFPWTGHIETVCCLYHQKKDFISVPYEPKDDDYLKNR